MASMRGYRELFVIQVRICVDVDRYAFSIPLPCQRSEENRSAKGTIDEEMK